MGQYKSFLQNHRKLDKVTDIRVEISGRLREVAIEQIFNIVQLVKALSFRNSIPELLENEVIGIGYSLGSEFLGLGIGESNFGKIFYSEVDFEEFIEIYPSFENLVSAINKV